MQFYSQLDPSTRYEYLAQELVRGILVLVFFFPSHSDGCVGYSASLKKTPLAPFCPERGGLGGLKLLCAESTAKIWSSHPTRD